MLWILFAFLAAFFQATRAVFSKKSLKNIDEYVVSFASRLIVSLLLLPILFFIEIPQLNSQFWFALITSGTLLSLNTILYMKAIKYSDISLAMPMISFTPLFLLLTSPIMVGEFPNFFGLAGILLIVMGSYVLNLKQKNYGYLAPFKKLLTDKGPRLMLCVAFIWSIGSNFDKIGVINSSPLFWGLSMAIFMTIFLLPIAIYKSKCRLKELPKKIKNIFPIGLSSALELPFHMYAIQLALVSYVISIKRTSIIMSVLFGYFFFKEKNIKKRLIGAAVMVVGVLLITLFG